MQITIGAELAVNHGDDEPWRLSRLRWLNSTLAADGPPTPPYTPIRAVPGGFAILGRRIMLDSLGLPRQIESFFTDDMTAIGTRARSMLLAPISLRVEGAQAPLPRSGSGVAGTSHRHPRVKASRVQRFTAHGRDPRHSILM